MFRLHKSSAYQRALDKFHAMFGNSNFTLAQAIQVALEIGMKPSYAKVLCQSMVYQDHAERVARRIYKLCARP